MTNLYERYFKGNITCVPFEEDHEIVCEDQDEIDFEEFITKVVIGEEEFFGNVLIARFNEDEGYLGHNLDFEQIKSIVKF